MICLLLSLITFASPASAEVDKQTHLLVSYQLSLGTTRGLQSLKMKKLPAATIASIVVLGLGMAKESWVDDPFEWNDQAYNLAGVLLNVVTTLINPRGPWSVSTTGGMSYFFNAVDNPSPDFESSPPNIPMVEFHTEIWWKNRLALHLMSGALQKSLTIGVGLKARVIGWKKTSGLVLGLDYANVTFTTSDQLVPYQRGNYVPQASVGLDLGFKKDRFLARMETRSFVYDRRIFVTPFLGLGFRF